MSEVTKSLKTIAKGTIFSSAGMVFALVFSFLQRWAIIRITTPEEYGLYSLSLAVVAVFLSVCGLGLQEGIPRTVSYYSSTAKISKEKMISSLLFLALLSGGLCLLFLIVASSAISSFFKKDIAWIILVVALSVPFSLLLQVLLSFFRGIEKAEVKVIFNDVLKNCLFLSALIFIFVKNLSFHAIITGYITSIIISALFIVVYTVYRIGVPRFRGMVPFAKVLLVFSLPLLGGSLFQLITTWADTLLLGFLRSAEEIAHYNAALPTSKLIQTTMAAFLFLYLPVATSLVSKGLKSEMKKVYAVVSKWVVFINLPLFMVLFLNADTLFLFLYGSAYASAILPFRIIACGYFLRDFFGPSGGTLIALGKTKTMMMIVSATAVINLSCNAVLIPRYGMVGAAISMLATLCTAAALKGSILYKTSGIHPFGATFVKPIIPSLLLIGGVQQGLEQVISLEAWMLPALFVVYMGIHGFSLIITKSVDQEDIWMLLIFEKRIGINLAFLKKIVKKLLR